MASRGLKLVFLTMLSFVSLTHSACNEEEPKNDPSDIYPDLNITVLPSLVARVGDILRIICVADKPRYVFMQGTRPKLPNRAFAVFDNGVIQKPCPRSGGRIKCVLNVPLTKMSNNVSVACSAANDDGCRTLTVFVTVLEKSNQSSSKLTLVQSPSLTLNVLTSSPMKTMPLSSSTANANFTSSIPYLVSSLKEVSQITPLPTSTYTGMASKESAPEVTSSQTPTSSGESGGISEGLDSLEDDEELDDVKKLITATLVLVIIMLLLMTAAIIYALRVIKT